MSARLGIDLSSTTAALAHVSEGRRGLQLRGFALMETSADLDTIAAELRQARRTYRFPHRAEVIAWPGDIRADAAREAGYRIERVISPADALCRVARLHHGVPAPERVSAVVSLHPDSGALAVVRNGQILHESALRWSHAALSPSQPELLRRYAFLAELSEHLRGAFAAVRAKHDALVTEVLTCGSVPDLRSLTMPLADEFDLDVETLDSAAGIEIRMKPAPAERAREVMAALKLAIVAGRRSQHAHGWPPLGRPARTAGGVAAAAAVAVLTLALWPRGGTPGAQPSAGSAPLAPAKTAAAPAQKRKPSPAPPQTPPALKASTQARPPAPVAAPIMPETASVAATVASPPAAQRRTQAETALAAVAASSRPEPPVRAVDTPAGAAQARPERGRIDPPRTLRSVDRLPPFEARVSSILWSSDRQFAVVDGRIVGVGDNVRGAQITEIRADALIVRDGAGRLRRAPLMSGSTR